MKNAWKCNQFLLCALLVACTILQEGISYAFSVENESVCSNDTQASLLEVRGCACDPECRRYGDCCHDSPFFKPEEQKSGASPYVCSSFAPLYLIGKCPPDWVNPVVRHSCEHPDETFRNPMRDFPVTSLISNQSYVNFYCAACHGDLHPGAIEIWTFTIDCDTMPGFTNFSAHEYAKYLAYDTSQSTWYLNIPVNDESSWNSDVAADDEALNTCELIPVMSDTARTQRRSCEQYVVSSCPESWTDNVVRERCEAYTSYICFGFQMFRNQHCVVCNNASTVVGCLKNKTQSISSRFVRSFSVLIDWRRMKQTHQCTETEIYDPFLDRCREIFDIETSEEDAETLGSCVKVSLSQEEYELSEDNSSAYVPAHNKTYYKHEFLIHNNFLVICLPEEADNHFTPELGYFTMVGLTLSILFLVLHLSVFIMVPKLRNFSATNLSCLCISLLLLYVIFIVSGSMKPRTPGCIAMATLIHYSLLASFFWMLTISFDIFRVMKQATSKLLVCKGRQRLRFCLYCTGSWLFPAVIVGAGLAMDNWCPESHLAPGYGQGACWLNRSEALLIFCVAPLAVVVVFNVCFFCWTAYLIHVNSDAAPSASSTRKEFPLFLRLGFIMGITWITGVAAASVEVPGLWHLFVIFNTLQGLFIFVAFTCTEKVWKEVRNVMYGHKILTRITTAATTTQSTTDTRSSEPAMQNRHLLNT